MNRSNDNMSVITLVSVVILSLVFVLAINFTKSYFEAKSYNKLTGGNATAWDAMWVKLRVDGRINRD